MTGTTNRLIKEKSPYLLQHAYNPVDWYPWGNKAFEKAQKEDRPLFLSIGYSTCHWCHMMAHESFEDGAVAALINRAFVPVKVDREERPDLDNVYMAVCHMLTGSGGWPLTIIMTPDRRPFFAGTYIPKETGFGRTGLIDLIPKIESIWRERRSDVLDTADQIAAALKEMDSSIIPGPDPDASVLEKAYNELAGRYDRAHGGFGDAPKFPSPHNIMFLLRYWRRTAKGDALKMSERTIRSIRQGGIFDHIGLGLHRYSTDSKWLVPHFEKMLYDQAILALASLETFQATGNTLFSQTAREIFTYVMRDMTSPDGGFYSAEDADSEGQEGRFYLWEKSEIQEVLGGEDAEIFCRLFGIEKAGNFRDEATGRMTRQNILHMTKDLSMISQELGIDRAFLQERIRLMRQKLFNRRELRVRPARDDKVLTDWNGLMIAALARGAQVLEDTPCLDAAVSAAGFIISRMLGPGNRLLHRYRNGDAAVPANLDDYAFLIWGLIELYEASFDAAYLKTALDLNEVMLELFSDNDRGGLFFTAKDAEELPVRKRETYDGAVPSGNSVAMLNLLRLARMTGRAGLEERAFKIGRAFSGQIMQMPSAYTFFLCAVDFAIGPSYDVVIAGESKGKDTMGMVAALRRRFIPNKTVIIHPTEAHAPMIEPLSGFVKDYATIDNRATAYVCINRACSAPTVDVPKMLENLGIE